MSTALIEYLKADNKIDDCLKLIGASEDQRPRVEKYLKAFLLVIAKSPQLRACDRDSIYNCFRDSLVLGLPVDARQLTSVVPRKGNAVLQVGYQGFLYKLKKEVVSADPHLGIVMKDQDLEWAKRDGNVSYNLPPSGDPFSYDYATAKGAYCVIYYKVDGEQRSCGEVMNKAELDKVKGCASYGDVWNKWPGEMMKKTIIKRACKVHFASSIQDLIDYDNRDYSMDTPADTKEGFDVSVVDVTSEEVKTKFPEGIAEELAQEQAINNESTV